MKSIFHRAAALAVLLSSLTPIVQAATKDEWRSRSIYRLLTDRFAPASEGAPCDVQNGQYCGGSFKTIMSKLDYIQNDLGFDAIWISPISVNLEGQTAYGQAYHGFWPTDLFSINPHFGTPEDLKALSDELHRRGMFLMVDTVLNHLASTSTSLDPAKLQSEHSMFTDPNEYHPYCPVDYSNRESQLKCWMGDQKVALMDLNTENENVIRTLTDGVKNIVAEYGIDGMRLDAIKHIPIQLAIDICKNAGNSYCIGEVYSSSPGEQAKFQRVGVEALENYALFYGFQKTFGRQEGMREILNIMQAVAREFPDVGVLGTFIENHDQVRFAQLTQDKALTYNALAFQFLTDGIPIHYYGMEQDMPGGNDPENRAALWTRGYQMGETAQRTAAINKIHRAFASHGDVVFGDKNFIDSRVGIVAQASQDGAIRKGPVLTVVTNRGSSGAGEWKVDNSGWEAQTEIIELLTCKAMTVAADKSILVVFEQGAPQVFATAADAKAVGLCGSLTPESTASATVSGTASLTPSGTALSASSTSTRPPSTGNGSASEGSSSGHTTCKRNRKRLAKQ